MQSINDDIKRKTGARQWRNSQEVLGWFSNIDNKARKKLLLMDVVEFYPSITEDLLKNAIKFGRIHTHISYEVERIIMNARKSVLFHDGKTWIKNSGDLFDVTMGSYDGAEICELVGLFLLDQVKQQIPALDIGLYRDDSLGVHEDIPGPDLERMKKKLIAIFKQNSLKITIETNLDQVNFLDVSLRLSDNTYWPYQKPNNTPLYIHAQSNHPANIKKSLPSMISKRLSTISSDQTQFNKSKQEYDKALLESGFTEKTTYSEQIPTEKNRTRHRNIIWFNPPYSENVDTNIGHKFLNLIKKHFPPGNKLAKIFNTNTLKLSYSCMPNMKNIISKHNKKVLATVDEGKTQEKMCNCRIKSLCPMDGQCLQQALVYKATLTSENVTKAYIGLTENTFKERFRNHKQSLQHPEKSASTQLSQHFWKLKSKGCNTSIESISWEMLKKSSPYQCGTRKCDLCLTEKLAIIQNRSKDLLNKRTEIANKCRHNTKYKLCNVK